MADIGGAVNSAAFPVGKVMCRAKAGLRRGDPNFAPALFDDLVGAREQRCREREAERPRSVGVDHQLELRRLLHGQIGGTGAREDFVDAGGGARSGKLGPYDRSPPATTSSRWPSDGSPCLAASSASRAPRIKNIEWVTTCRAPRRAFAHRRESIIEVPNAPGRHELQLHAQRPGPHARFRPSRLHGSDWPGLRHCDPANVGDGPRKQFELLGIDVHAPL